jgi:hypothetical protein
MRARDRYTELCPQTVEINHREVIHDSAPLLGAVHERLVSRPRRLGRLPNICQRFEIFRVRADLSKALMAQSRLTR